jgi:adenylate kinase family enzyme
MKTCAHGLIRLGCACIIVADLLVNAMDESGMTRFLVDGFPRTEAQVRIL